MVKQNKRQCNPNAAYLLGFRGGLTLECNDVNSNMAEKEAPAKRYRILLLSIYGHHFDHHLVFIAELLKSQVIDFIQ